MAYCAWIHWIGWARCFHKEGLLLSRCEELSLRVVCISDSCLLCIFIQLAFSVWVQEQFIGNTALHKIKAESKFTVKLQDITRFSSHPLCLDVQSIVFRWTLPICIPGAGGLTCSQQPGRHQKAELTDLKPWLVPNKQVKNKSTTKC